MRLVRLVLTALALGLPSAAVLSLATQAAAAQAPGVVTISPTSVTAASKGNNFSLTYSAPSSQGVTGSVSFNVPPKWTKPQESRPTALGFAAIQAGSCSQASLGPVATNADGSWTVIAAVTCAAGKSFSVTYSRVTAVKRTGLNQFTAKGRFSPSTTFLPFASEPNVTVNPGPAATLAFDTQPSTTTAGGHILPSPSVAVLDASGNLTASSASVTVSIATNPAGGTLSGTTTVAASGGVATYSDLSINKAGSVYTLAANSVGLVGAVSVGFNISPATPATLAFGIQPSTTSTRVDISAAPTVRILDSYGNLTSSAATVTVAIRDNPGGGTLSGNTIVAASGGTATFVHISIDKAAFSYTIAATSPGLSATTSSAFDVTPVARDGHTATLLPNGKVLVAGGSSSLGYLASAQLYDPGSGTWSTTGSLAVARTGHTATLLANGKVLVAGGQGNANPFNPLDVAELYDPLVGTWSKTGAMTAGRTNHTATLLPGGKVLLVAGAGTNNTPIASADLYDPATGTWSATSSIATARTNHTATLLSNGKVLVAGGTAFPDPLASAELYDPASGRWSATGSMATARASQTATLLPGGKVLVAGGNGTAGTWLSSAELFDPTLGSWSTTGSLTVARFSHTATLLSNGKVLVAGGNGKTGSSVASAELYDPAGATWSVTGTMVSARAFHTATLLSNGEVLAVAGAGSGSLLASAELYDAAAATWSATGSLVGS